MMVPKEELEKLYKQHFCLPFPKMADNEALYDFQADLTEIDGFVVGFLESCIKSGKQPPDQSVIDFVSLKAKLDSIEVDSKDDYENLLNTKNYVFSLEKIWQALFFYLKINFSSLEVTDDFPLYSLPQSNGRNT